ncbi:MAG: hypothetical protein N3D20_01470 [Candidatus Pacearchaeota archaeon]|nr:hypothetical protein [Candidatus Pacearchaeota archaeon]
MGEDISDKIIQVAREISSKYGLDIFDWDFGLLENKTIVSVAMGKCRDNNGIIFGGFSYMIRLEGGKVVEENLIYKPDCCEARRAYEEFILRLYSRNFNFYS